MNSHLTPVSTVHSTLMAKTNTYQMFHLQKTLQYLAINMCLIIMTFFIAKQIML